jgi:elongator complex protein 6
MSRSFPSTELTFYENDSIFNSSPSKTLSLITNTLETSSTWLVDLVTSKILKDSATHSVTIVQFINKTSLHQRGITKYGVEIDSSSKLGTLKLVDISDQIFKVGSNGFDGVDANELESYIKSTIEISNTTNRVDGSANRYLILENVDVLLTAGNTPERILTLIHNLHAVSSHIQIICNADSPLVTPGTYLSDSHGLLVNHLIHRSSLVVSLRPLETGRADDVTGVLRITRGPKVSQLKVIENEYLYFVTSDNVKIIHR